MERASDVVAAEPQRRKKGASAAEAEVNACLRAANVHSLVVPT